MTQPKEKKDHVDCNATPHWWGWELDQLESDSEGAIDKTKWLIRQEPKGWPQGRSGKSQSGKKPNILKQFQNSFVSFSRNLKKNKFIHKLFLFCPGLSIAKLTSQNNLVKKLASGSTNFMSN